jgi:hypothetical protein
MAVGSFPEELYFRVLGDSPGELYLGSYVIGGSGEFYAAILSLYMQGTASGSEGLTLNVYSTFQRDNLLFSSDWSDVADIGSLGSNWFGKLRFLFDNQVAFANAAIEYHIFIESRNYIRNGNTFYIATKFDWPIATNNPAIAGKTGADLALFVRER